MTGCFLSVTVWEETIPSVPRLDSPGRLPRTMDRHKEFICRDYTRMPGLSVERRNDCPSATCPGRVITCRWIRHFYVFYLHLLCVCIRVENVDFLGKELQLYFTATCLAPSKSFTLEFALYFLKNYTRRLRLVQIHDLQLFELILMPNFTGLSRCATHVFFLLRLGKSSLCGKKMHV